MIYFEANVTTTNSAPSMYPQQPDQQQQQSQKQQPIQDHNHQQQLEYDSDASAVLSKFSEHDLQVLKQLLVTGEKNKWKQITKEINTQASMRRNGVTNVNDLPPDSAVSSPTDDSFNGRGDGSGNSKNVSPTFVIKQYQSLLGLPNNQLYFGSLGSSLPYIVAERGWDDIEEAE